MPRLIDADALTADMLFRCNQEIVKYKTMRHALGNVGRAAFNSVKNAPTIDAEPVRRGRWIDDMYFDEPVTRCTWCNRGFAKGHKAERFPYCPNCGAKMMEVQDD